MRAMVSMVGIRPLVSMKLIIYRQSRVNSASLAPLPDDMLQCLAHGFERGS
jgi:hypothetical protein